MKKIFSIAVFLALIITLICNLPSSALALRPKAYELEKRDGEGIEKEFNRLTGETASQQPAGNISFDGVELQEYLIQEISQFVQSNHSFLINSVKTIHGKDIKLDDIKICRINAIGRGTLRRVFGLTLVMSDDSRIKLALKLVAVSEKGVKLDEIQKELEELKFSYSSDPDSVAKPGLISKEWFSREIGNVFVSSGEWVEGFSLAELERALEKGAISVSEFNKAVKRSAELYLRFWDLRHNRWVIPDIKKADIIGFQIQDGKVVTSNARLVDLGLIQQRSTPEEIIDFLNMLYDLSKDYRPVLEGIVNVLGVSRTRGLLNIYSRKYPFTDKDDIDIFLEGQKKNMPVSSVYRKDMFCHYIPMFDKEGIIAPILPDRIYLGNAAEYLNAVEALVNQKTGQLILGDWRDVSKVLGVDYGQGGFARTDYIAITIINGRGPVGLIEIYTEWDEVGSEEIRYIFNIMDSLKAIGIDPRKNILIWGKDFQKLSPQNITIYSLENVYTPATGVAGPASLLKYFILRRIDEAA